MAFTTAEINNIANAAIDFHKRGPTWAQSIQNKPLLKALDENKKQFPGGKGNITVPVQGDYASSDANFAMGYNTNDTVTYVNPTNIQRASYAWKELHAGITCTFSELKIDGITVDDNPGQKSFSEHSDRELTVLTGLLQNKLEDMDESWQRFLNTMFWQDGTQDAKEIAGIQSLITATPLTGTTGGINRATYSWWRNRAYVGAGTNANGAAIAVSATNQTLTKRLREEVRQLKRYARKTPKYILLAGSAFLEGLDAEVAEKGYYTQTGFSKGDATDIGLAEIQMRGIGTFVYDPTLDDLSLSKRCYFIDLNCIKQWAMEDEFDKMHYPQRPHDQYALFRSITRTGGLVAEQLNTSAVYEVQ